MQPLDDEDMMLSSLPRGSKVLVTGATGFIGGRLVERLVGQLDVRVHCIVRNLDRAARLRRLPVELLQVNLCNANQIGHAVEGVNYVFHCAYDWQSRRQNIDGLRNLISACSANSVDRLVHVSTFAVYEPFPDGILTEETADGDRSNVYVNTKLDLEQIILEAICSRHISCTIVQPTIVYGPYSVPWTIIPAERLICGDVVLPGRGEGICNAVYVDDLVDGLILAALSPAAIGERFIMSGPEPVTWETFFTQIATAVGAEPPKFWPREQIAAATAEAQRKAHRMRLIRLLERWRPVRRALRVSIDTTTGVIRTILRRHHPSAPDPHENRFVRRELFLPEGQALALYCSKAPTGSEKARLTLGYRPKIDFQCGMILTRPYLEQAYGHLR